MLDKLTNAIVFLIVVCFLTLVGYNFYLAFNKPQPKIVHNRTSLVQSRAGNVDSTYKQEQKKRA